MTAEGLPAPWGEVQVIPEVGLNRCSPQVTQLEADTPGEECTATTDSEAPICRICHEDTSSGELLSPCECCGSLAMVHRACLEHWLTASNSSHCELCHHQFALERLPKPLTEWLCSPSVQQQRRTLWGDAVCFLFITPLAGLSGWLCVQGAMELYYTNGMEALGLLVLTLALFSIYVFWTLVRSGSIFVNQSVPQFAVLSGSAFLTFVVNTPLATYFLHHIGLYQPIGFTQWLSWRLWTEWLISNARSGSTQLALATSSFSSSSTKQKGVCALSQEFVPDVEEDQQESEIADSLARPQHTDPTVPVHKHLLQAEGRHQQGDYGVDCSQHGTHLMWEGGGQQGQRHEASGIVPLGERSNRRHLKPLYEPIFEAS
ncbi:uncharacterized protein AB9W97_011191 isoform 2-T2 [Spinachia spinachia]